MIVRALHRQHRRWYWPITRKWAYKHGVPGTPKKSTTLPRGALHIGVPPEPPQSPPNGQKLLLICMGFSSITADTPQLILVSQNTIGGQRLLELGFSRAHKWSSNSEHACTACQGLRMPARAHTVATFVAHPKKAPPRGLQDKSWNKPIKAK
jgi:hypothetical protein